MVLYPQPAGKELLGQVELQFGVLARNVADVGMGEGVVANLVAFPVNPLG